ncbi:fatty acid desaturase [Myxococcota bacterium]|nr:fatty acid desaturase [Myxococcota bacterium]
MARAELRSWPIPSGLNLVVTALVVVGQLLCLALATHGGAWGWTLLGALVYGTLGQPAFALLHEAEHGKLHPNPRVNEALGALLGALFPGAFSILRAAHLLHHRRNRSEEEMIDLYRPGERLKKTLSYYALISGLIWIGSPLLALALCVVPWPKVGGGPAAGPRNIRLAEFLSFLEGVRPWAVRAEVTLTLALWAGLAWGLQLALWPTLACLAAFATLWASQQYVYHVRTPLHLVEGAFDLAMPRWMSLFYLRFNYHLTHHRQPMVPWLYLPEVAEEPPWRPYGLTWLRSWAPPRPMSAAAWPSTWQRRGPLPPDPPPELRRPE